MAMEQQTTNIDLSETCQPMENGSIAAAPGIVLISEERKLEIANEMDKLQDEINTLKQALLRKDRQLQDLRAELGLTRYNQAVTKSKQVFADASVKTCQALKDLSTITGNKWTEIKESPRMQNVSEKFWLTTGAVKAKLVGERKPVEGGEPPAAQIVVTPDGHHH